MTILEAVLLGILQGVTEFIPVSSSGHLFLAQYFLGQSDMHVFAMLINIGTLLALLFYFRHKIITIVGQVSKGEYRLVKNLMVSAIPVGIAGLLLDDIVAHPFVQNPWMVCVMMLVVGIVMVVVSKINLPIKVESIEETTTKSATFIGLAQLIALLPGASRSASTILAGRLTGLNYRTAAEYSFLLSIPVMLAVICKALSSAEGQLFIGTHTIEIIVANFVAFVVGSIAVRFMLRFLEQKHMRLFGYYRIALAIIIITTFSVL